MTLSGPTAFAGAMARARARLDLRVAAPSMTLFRLPACLHVSRVEQHGPQVWAPRLRLGLTFAGVASGPGRAHDVGVPPRVDTLRLSPPALERLHSRMVRQETVRDERARPRVPVPSPATAGAPLPQAAAVPRVLARLSSHKTPSEGAKVVASPAPWPGLRADVPFASNATHAPHVEAAPPRKGLAPGELERITDHVLHAVSRRMTAYNERRGR